MFITTALKYTEELIEQAKKMSAEWNVPFIERRELPIERLIDQWQMDALVIGKQKLFYYLKGSKEPFFFHPNSAMFRYKRLLKGERDPLLEVSQLEEGMSFLDCTLGLAADSIIAQYRVGSKGKVIGIEKSFLIGLLF